jgi:hypothetical protein
MFLIKFTQNKNLMIIPPSIAILLNILLIYYIEQITSNDPGYMFPAGHLMIPIVVFIVWSIFYLILFVWKQILK